jgi:hypothetical protein
LASHLALDDSFNPAVMLHAIREGVAYDADSIAFLEWELGENGRRKSEA